MDFLVAVVLRTWEACTEQIFNSAVETKKPLKYSWVSDGVFGNEGAGMWACHVITGLVSSCVEAEIIAGVLNCTCAYHNSLPVVLTWIFLIALVSLKTAYC